MRIDPYPAEAVDLGATRDGRSIQLVPMTDAAAATLGDVTATFGPWLAYGFSAAAMARSFAPVIDNATRYQTLVEGTLAGAMVIRNPWLIGPYLQTLAVLPDFQSGGIGGVMLNWFEARARLAKQRSIWLCVAGFNKNALRFYLAHGWEHAADLPDLIQDGVGELLLRKRLMV
jgi:diamine N-acetyltransferase